MELTAVRRSATAPPNRIVDAEEPTRHVPFYTKIMGTVASGARIQGRKQTMLTKNKPALPIASTCEGDDCQGCPACPEYTISTCQGEDCKGCENFYHGRAGLVAWLNADASVDHSVSGAPPETYTEFWAEHGPIPKPTPTPQTTAYTLENTLNAEVCGVSLDYQEPPLPVSMRCPTFGRQYKVRRCVMGTINYQPFACGECPQCREAWAWRKLYRYSQGVRRSHVQTFILVDGLADDHEAADVKAYFANRLRCTRFSILSRNPDTYLWRCVVVTQEPISRQQSVLGEHHAAQRYPTAEIAFCDRMVNADSLRPYLNGKAMTPGGHKPTQFSQDWIKTTSR